MFPVFRLALLARYLGTAALPVINYRSILYYIVTYASAAAHPDTTPHFLPAFDATLRAIPATALVMLHA